MRRSGPRPPRRIDTPDGAEAGSQWEDVRLRLFDQQMTPLPGKAYGKVTEIKIINENPGEAQIHFTSVSPEIRKIIQRVIGFFASND
jgi:hypothetical protein